MSSQSSTRISRGHTDYGLDVGKVSIGAHGKVSTQHLEQRRSQSVTGSHDVAYAKGKVGVNPGQASGRTKLCLVKVREDAGPLKVRGEALSGELGGSVGWTGGKVKANASLAKVQVEVYGVGVQGGLSVDNKVKAQVWPPQVGGYVCGTGAEFGLKKTKFTILGNGLTLRNPWYPRKPLTKNSELI